MYCYIYYTCNTHIVTYVTHVTHILLHMLHTYCYPCNTCIVTYDQTCCVQKIGGESRLHISLKTQIRDLRLVKFKQSEWRRFEIQEKGIPQFDLISPPPDVYYLYTMHNSQCTVQSEQFTMHNAHHSSLKNFLGTPYKVAQFQEAKEKSRKVYFITLCHISVNC